MLFAGVGQPRDEDAMKAGESSLSGPPFNQNGTFSTIESLWSETAVLEDATANNQLAGRETIMGQLKRGLCPRQPTRSWSISKRISHVRDRRSNARFRMNTLRANDSDESFAFTALIPIHRWQMANHAVEPRARSHDGFGQSPPSVAPSNQSSGLIGV